MRVRAALAWTLGMVAAVIGLGHGAASAQQPTPSVRTQAVSASPTQNHRGSLIETGTPTAVAVASKHAAKQQHRTAPVGLTAHDWTLFRPTLGPAEPAVTSQPVRGVRPTGQNVRAPPGVAGA